MPTAKSRKSTRSEPDSVVVDFSDTETRGGRKGTGGRKHYPEGDYKVKVKAAKFGHSGEKESPRLEVTYVFSEGKHKGKDVRDDLYLTPKALWRLRQTLEALGVKVPDKKAKVNPANLIGKGAAVTLEDEEYDGKIYSRVTDTYTLEDWADTAADIDEDEEDDEEDDDEGDDEEEEESEDEDEEEDDEKDEDLDDLDLEDL